MKNLLLAALCFVTTISLASTEPIHGGKIDVNASTVNWTGKKVTGEHSGTIKIKSGDLKMHNGDLTGGSFVIDMTSLACTDLPAGPGGKLVGHLASDDFFGVANYPTANLKITDVKKDKNAGNFSVTADLTIKGITKPVQFTADVKDHAATANITIERTQYGIKYGSGSFFDGLGDKMIYDNFDLSVKLVMQH